MKRRIGLLLTIGMTVGLLSGCAGVPVAVNDKKEDNVKEETAIADGDALKTGLSVITTVETENASAEADGTATANISLIAVTVNDSGVIDSCIIDAVQGTVSVNAEGAVTSQNDEIQSKNELGEAYGMKAYSPIGKEWNEQVAAIAAYAEGKTVEELKNGAIDEYGVVKDVDLASSATIYLGGFVSGIEDAVNQAQYLGASKGDELILTSISNGAASTAATEESDGTASVTSNIIAMTQKDEVITSCIIDSVQIAAAFDGNGIFTEDAAGEVLSKNQLGENYGLKMFSPIGKEWNEQVAAFCAYVTGKTAEEAAGIAVTETTAPAEADLASSVTIAVGDFMRLIEKAVQ